MTLGIEKEAQIDLGFDEEKLIEQVVSQCLAYLQCPYEAELNIVLTDNKEIAQINMDYRDVNLATDVLSFPMLDFERAEDFNLIEKNKQDYFHPETNELMLGDIMISLEKVVEQAEAYGHSRERELGFLVAHSILHLFGYDHMDEQDAKIMERKQEEIMNLIQLHR